MIKNLTDASMKSVITCDQNVALFLATYTSAEARFDEKDTSSTRNLSSGKKEVERAKGIEPF